VNGIDGSKMEDQNVNPEDVLESISLTAEKFIAASEERNRIQEETKKSGKCIGCNRGKVTCMSEKIGQTLMFDCPNISFDCRYGKSLVELFKKEIARKMIETCGVPERHVNVINSDDFKKTESIKKTSKWDYSNNVILVGSIGTGKSVCAAHLVKRFLYDRCGRDPLDYLKWYTCLPDIARRVVWTTPYEFAYIQGAREKAMNSILLIVDDMGKDDERIKNHTNYIIGKRYDMNRPTIFTTNDSLEVIRSIYGQRTYDRLLGATVITITGESKR